MSRIEIQEGQDSLLFDFLTAEKAPLWHGMADGLRQGDPLTDELLTLQQVAMIGHSPEATAEWIRERLGAGEKGGWSEPELQMGVEGPGWVDRAAVERGQALFLKHFYAFFTLLIAVLLNGFVISRFSEVLVLSGYARSPRETYLRFRSTALQIWLWMSHSLFDPLSPARVSLLQVRCLHGLARGVTRTREAWNEEVHFVPLSQFDLSLVLLGFSSITLDGVAHEMGVRFTPRERDDFIHLWRCIGWHLGIKDEYNPCNSTGGCFAMLDEFYASIVPHLTGHPRPSSLQLLNSAIDGFGHWTPMSVDMCTAILFLRQTSRPLPALDQSWTRIAGPNPVAAALLRKWVDGCQNSRLMALFFNALFMNLLIAAWKFTRAKNAVEHVFAYIWSPFVHFIFVFLQRFVSS